MDAITHSIIRERRLAKGWTQAKLAKRAKVGRVDVSRWENGKHKPSPLTARKLAKALGGVADDYI